MIPFPLVIITDKKINHLKIKKENKQITYYNIINVDVTLTATMEG